MELQTRKRKLNRDTGRKLQALFGEAYDVVCNFKYTEHYPLYSDSESIGSGLLDLQLIRYLIS